MINLLLTLIFIVWPFGQLAIMPALGGQNWFILDLLTTLLWFSLLFSSKRRLIVKDPFFVPWLIFIATATASLLLNLPHQSPAQILLASAYLLRFIASTSVYFALRQTKIKPALIIFSISTFVVLGLLQYFLLPDMRFLKYLNFDDHYYRLIGTMFDPNFTGLILVQIIFVAFFLLPKKIKSLSLLPILALALTFSRASYLCLSAALIFLGLKTKRLQYILAIVLIVSLFVFLAPKPGGEGINLWRTFSIFTRLENSWQALSLFLQKPFLGWGLNFLPLRISNSYLYILATTGLVGFAAFVYFLTSLWHLSSKSLLLQIILSVVLVHSLFNNSFFYLWESLFLFAALAIARS